MSLSSKLAGAWRSWFDGERLDRELRDEVRGYFDELVERKVRDGLEPQTARREARLEMGNLDVIEEDVRAGRVGAAVESVWMDVRYALRGLRRSPGFSVAAVLTLALGIGANTAIFTVVNALLIEPLPFRDPSRLVFIWSDMTSAGYPRAPLSGPELNDLRERATLFDGFGAIWANTGALTGDGDPEQLRIGLVSANFFSVLGAEPAIGRSFNPGDEGQGPPTVIVLSWPVFERRYGGDRSIVGRRVLLNGQAMTVIGVMPRRFRLMMPPDAAVPDDTQAWILFNAPFTRGPRGQQYLRVVGRMKGGVTVEQARREVDAIASQIGREFTEYGGAGRAFTTVSLQADGVRELKPTLLSLFGGVGILLLIACVNVASLLAARAAARSRETAVRAALGANRGRLLRQCLVEGLVLTSVGACAAIVVAEWSLAPVLSLRPAVLERLGTVTLDMRVLAFTAATALGWGMVMSCAPMLELLRIDVAGTLHQEVRTRGAMLVHRTRAALVVVQIGLCVVLLVAAGLLVRSFLRIQSIDPGFQPQQVLTFKIAIPGSRYRGRDAFNALARRVHADIAALPGVRQAGAISHLPFDNLPNWGGPYLPEGSRAMADANAAPHADLRAVTPGLFETIGATLVEGRFLTEDDDPRSALVAVVDDLLVRRTWPGGSGLGKRIMIDPGSTGKAAVPATVVGVVKHLRQRSLIDPLSEQVFLPERVINRSPLSYVVRTDVPPAELAPVIRGAIAKLDPLLPVYDVKPLDEYVAGARSTQRFAGVLALGFALLAVTLACVGVYGVMAYAITRRRYEFGVRLALGATPQELVRMGFAEGVRLTALGALLGVGCAAIAAQAIRSQLFGVTPLDTATYAIAVAVIGASSLAASWLPARRAAGASPLDVLRSL